MLGNAGPSGSRTRACPRVFFVGAPAAGKTTLRAKARELCVDFGWSPRLLGIEEQHRKLYPRSKAGSDFVYTEDGALVLLDRANQIPRSLKLLQEAAAEAVAEGGFLLELAHEDVGQALFGFGEELLRDALVVEVIAPVEVRVERNAGRGALQVPEHIVTCYPEALTPEVVSDLRAMGAHHVQLHTAAEPDRSGSELRSALEALRERIESGD